MARELRKSTQERSAVSKMTALKKAARKSAAAALNPIRKKGTGLLSRTSRRVYKTKNGLLSLKMREDTQHITIANSINSPLLRLPAEIRTEIFKLASTNNIGTVDIKVQTPDVLEVRGCGGIAIRLPQVCRQIYAETATMFYAENTFILDDETEEHDGVDVRHWLMKRLPAQNHAITSLVVSQCDCIPVDQEEMEEVIKKFCPQLKTFRLRSNVGQEFSASIS